VNWLEWAQRELGVHETPGPQVTERIVYYDSFTSLKATSDEVPWCSAFACAAVENSKIPSPKSARARDWLGWGQTLGVPRLGCVVVMSRGGDPNQGHVGFFLGTSGDYVKVLGGNQHDAVSIANFKRADVLSYRWPEGMK
jgi:uncharacterized protein (TIGR02594 family)